MSNRLSATNALVAVWMVRVLRPMAVLLALTPVWAGMVVVEAPQVPTLVVDEAAFPVIGSRRSSLVFSSNPVTIKYRLGPYESLIVEALDLPAAVQRVELHLFNHRFCTARHAFVEVGFSDPVGFVSFPELFEECTNGGIALADELLVVCHGGHCQGGAIAAYRPALAPSDEPIGFGVFQASYALAVDVTAGESFAQPLTMRYSVGSVIP
jgi:hypothetical protein